MLAKHLSNTSVRKVYLGNIGLLDRLFGDYGYIKADTQQLLKEKYPYIKWVF